MSPDLKEFLEENKEKMPINWNKEQQAQELAFWALEAGFGELPQLDIFGGYAAQRKYDQLVEEAFTYLVGEARRVLA